MLHLLYFINFQQIFCHEINSEPIYYDTLGLFPTVTEMIIEHGYPVETHEVQTMDGYLLNMHRIPNGINRTTEFTTHKPVAFLQHGLLSSSEDWVVLGPERALAYLLADEGYDVWMGNARGNTHSRRHVSLSPESEDFWNFSWHEIAMFDLPAMIDYVLKHTGQKKLHYIGFSQGTTCLLVMLSLKPKYNNVIITAHALAPVAYMSNLRSPLIRAFAPFISPSNNLEYLLGTNEFTPSNLLMQLGGHLLCKATSPFQEVCANVIFLIGGFDSEQLNRTLLPTILTYTPAGASTKQLIHYGQLYNSGYFRQYDYGTSRNSVKYRKQTPPIYPLRSITAPIALYYSENDWLATIADVKKLRVKLKNVIGKYLVPLPKFNHLDFIWAKDARSLLYNKVLHIMNSAIDKFHEY
ncbi:lipase 3-like [Phlebotomus papatasi]|uniref:lipase 3-like n=1 Tax=Phlebotomus papatasi TaxID=29031 RepID=UPI002483B169|nr:lipase 3-like [Phlebotomus papatasi]